MKAPLKQLLRQILPDSFKEFLFREAFAIMSSDMKDLQRRRYQTLSMEGSLKNLKRLGFTPKIIVDMGAYKGEWTEMINSIFPDSYVLMIEAQRSKEEYLKQVQEKYPQSVSYIISLLGAQSKEAVKFYEMETGSSVLEEQSDFSRTAVMLPTKTLDDIIMETKLSDVSFLKLDVQGFELEVLKGAKNTLRTVEVVLMEVALLGINKGAPLLHEVIQFMKDHDFLAYDICSLSRRAEDFVLLQVDLIFVKQDSEFRKNQRLSKGICW